MLTVSGLELGLEKNVGCQWSSVGIGENVDCQWS